MDGKCVNVKCDLNQVILNELEYSKAKDLFIANGIDIQNIQFYDYEEFESGFKEISCYKYFEGFKLFIVKFVCYFDLNDKFYCKYDDYDFYKKRILSDSLFDTLSTLDEQEIIQIFKNRINADEDIEDTEKQDIIEGCFELGLSDFP